METCRLCKQSFPDRKTLDRHPCPMAGGGGKPVYGVRHVLFALVVLAAVSALTWVFVTKRWAEDVLGGFETVVNPAHARILNGVAALLFAASWWHTVRLRFWPRLALTLLALLAWAASMPAVRAALF